MNEERFALFGTVYETELEQAVKNYPGEYVWPVEQVPTVAGRMLNAVRKHTFNKDGRAFKATCKALGIKHTYTAIYGWLDGESGSTSYTVGPGREVEARVTPVAFSWYPVAAATATRRTTTSRSSEWR